MSSKENNKKVNSGESCNEGKLIFVFVAFVATETRVLKTVA